MDANPGLPYAFCKKFGILVEQREDQHPDDGFHLKIRKNASVAALAEVRRVIGTVASISTVSEQQFNEALSREFEQSANNSILASEQLGGELDLEDVARELSEPEDLLESDDDAPIIRLINALITEAIKDNASDIHVEPFETRLSIRFRIDGVLREVIQPPRQVAALLVSRIKVMARLDIAEKRLPQDGRIALRIAGRPVDIRVSTLPSGHGERVVMRLLDKQAGRLNLSHLGMAEREEQRLR